MRWLTIVCVLLFGISTAGAEQPPTGWKLAFEEGFEQGLNRWEIFDPKTWALRKQDDGTQSFEILQRESEYVPKYRSPFHVALVREVQVGDFDLTFRVRSTLDTGGHRDCCIFFGYQDPTHFYYAHLGASPDPNSGQIMIVNDAARRPLTENTNPVPWDNEWHTVKVERRLADGAIRVYFDDLSKPHMEAHDSTFGAGRVGLGSFDDLDEFDDVRLIVPAE